ncbi:ATP-binding protein [Orrella sp. NBD-18]|uniref:ATP-binding protein n=1 Tax=Sheuella amnicola TaxID=2707330 RepID=A0A6B2R101_9BURK|nr:ATP-binding protein [Sheuella amnicola]NDY84450.1 ATP-binding protein [Sheuella amnicola]
MDIFAEELKLVEAIESECPPALECSALTTIQLQKLIDSSEEYGMTLRIWMLRTLLYTPALEQFNRSSSFTLAQVCEFLGLENYESFVHSNNLSALLAALKVKQNEWESSLGHAVVLPKRIKINLDKLSEIVALSENEKLVLGFFILLHTEEILSDCCNMIGNHLNEFLLVKSVAPVLGLEPAVLNNLLGTQSTLRKSGLIQFDMHNTGTLRYCIDLITPMFVSLMLKDQQNMCEILQGLVHQASAGHLRSVDYRHVKDRLKTVKTYLMHALKSKDSGVNVLIYGMNGTGKTQFAKLVAQELGCTLMEVSACNEAGDPISATRRFRSHRLAQPFFSQGHTIVLFDECEEVFDSAPMFAADCDKSPTAALKSYINQTLESNILPTIWIANSIDNFDLAYIRRFAICFEMNMPPETQRLRLLKRAFKGIVNQKTLCAAAKSPAISPALISKSATVLKTIAKNKTTLDLNQVALQLLNDKLRIQGATEIAMNDDAIADKPRFDPAFIHCDASLPDILDGMRQNGQGRLILFGPPGTGKTEAGKWLAKSLGLPHLSFKASDLLSPFVGECEQNIAAAFKRAGQTKALLQFDEVDSFLSQRAQSNQKWTITMVNQILTEIDSFEGIFIASTNRISDIDEAALRRFDMCLKFDFLTSAQSLRLFKATCAELEIKSDVEIWGASVQKLINLTPGDFAQILRQSKFVKHHTAQTVFNALHKATSLKKSTGARPMGFIQAA